MSLKGSKAEILENEACQLDWKKLRPYFQFLNELEPEDTEK